MTITLGEASRLGVWLKFCQMFGWNEWALNEGADENIEQKMTIEQAAELGILDERLLER